MSLQKSIIEDKVGDLVASTHEEKDSVFTKLVNSIIRDCDYDEIEPEDIVDGGDDKQVDVITIEEDTSAGKATVFILQSKNTDSYSTNYLTLMGNGLSWIFEKPREKFSKLKNVAFVRKIEEIRDLRNRLGPSNMSINAFFVTKGDTTTLSSGFKEELSEIRSKYEGGNFSSFHLEPLGAAELCQLIEENERKQKQISDELPINYDRNRPSYMRYSSHGVTGYICTVRGKEIARLVSGDNDKSIFDLNLRRYYGADKGRVNPDIAATCNDETEGKRFWFFNNGITIVCDGCDVVDDSDHPHVKLRNLQIVNGCQTSMTLAHASAVGQLREDVEVLVKIFVPEKRDEEFLGRIVLTTNNQNAVSSRDLKANDRVQIEYQRAFQEIYKLRYERKPGEFTGLTRQEQRQVISNEKVGQAFLAIVRKKPSLARAQKYRMWYPDLYPTIFPDSAVGGHVLAHLIYDYCSKRKKESLKRWEKDEMRFSIVSYGVFHLARVVARKFTGTESWNDEVAVSNWIEKLRAKPEILKPHYSASVTLIKNVIKRKPGWVESINNVFKATDIEGALNRALNPKKRKRKNH